MLSIIPSTNRAMRRDWTLARLARDMDRLLGAVGSTAHNLGAAQSTPVSAWPAVNVWREGENVVAEAEIPGFGIEDVEVLASEDELTIRGVRRFTTPENATALRIERSVGRFERSLRLPIEIEADSVEASLTNGVLRVTMPVAQSARARRVQIRALEHGRPQESLPESRSSTGEIAREQDASTETASSQR